MEQEENITVKKEEICLDNQTADDFGLEVLPISGSLGFESGCQGPSNNRKIDSLDMTCEPESQHLDTICLNIRIAIIRCFYSSSSCPSTALQKLKKEDNELCVTVNVEDINFFVQKFEKTGSVIGNHMNSSSLEMEDMVNTHSIVETIFDDPAENIESDREIENFAHSVFLPTSETSKDSHPKQDKKRKRKAYLSKKNRIDQSSSDSSEIQQPIRQAKKRSAGRILNSREILQDKASKKVKSKKIALKSEARKRSDKKKASPNQEREKAKNKKVVHRFPPLSKNECRICKKKCPDFYTFTYHCLNHFNMTFLPRDGPHKCPGCHKKFKQNSHLYFHLFRKCLLEKFDYSQFKQNSDSTQGSSVSLNSALTESSKDDGCISSNPSSSSLKNKMEQRENANLFQSNQIKDCDFSQNHQNLELTHGSSLTPTSMSNIPREDDCLASKQSSSFMQDQMEQSDQESNENVKASQKNKKIHRCPRCSKVLPDRRSLMYHVADHFNLDHLEGDPPYKCPDCEGLFKDRRILYIHLVDRCHKRKEKPKASFRCTTCNRAFQFEIQLEHHLLVHSGKAKPKVCHICEKKFADVTGFKRHLLCSHREKKAYQCDQCPRYFIRQRLLDEHKLSHSGTHLFTCDICGVHCDNSTSYQYHYRRHTTKPERYQCEICGKDFSGQDGYRRHKRIHTGEIVAVCDLCGKGFNRKNNLKIHKKSCQKQMHGVNQGSGGRKKISDPASGVVNSNGHSSEAINLHGRESGALDLHSRDSGAVSLHGRESGALNLPNRESGAFNLHERNPAAVNLHGRESGAFNLHERDSGGLNLHGREPGPINLHGHDSGAINLNRLVSGSETVNLHNLGSSSEAVNLHGLSSSSMASQQTPLWFKYNQQWF